MPVLISGATSLFGNYKTARESIKSECHQDLRRYREMNKQIRTSPAPVYFGTYPQFSDPVDSDELKAFGGRIAEARKRLSALEVDIDRANCDKEERLKKENDAFDKFIDDLTNAAASQVAGLPKPATSNS